MTARRPAATAAGAILLWAAVPAPGFAASAAGTGYRAYVALSGGWRVAEIDVATDKLLPDNIPADSVHGVAIAPDGSTVYATETGHYAVKVVDTATGKSISVTVGSYPQDVAVSPDGRRVFVTVTGSDTGPGGADTVAVIDTATAKVVADIKLGAAPRRVVFSPNGSRAWVTTATGVAVIDTATLRLADTIADDEPTGPQGLAVSPDGARVYVTNPAAGNLWVIDSANDRVRRRIPVGVEPYAVTAVRDSRYLYVADMNSDTVAVVDPGVGRIVRTIPVGRLPMSVAATADGSQVWVGNGLSGSISVIDTESRTVQQTIELGSRTSALNTEAVAIAFGTPRTP
ncbi:MAG TPA: beta-propeller fold lactonase family protein [Sporichthyaceae bacterium]|nr:beta-propeller fold lactonase family protein [Sporichthyaceae bacterium]